MLDQECPRCQDSRRVRLHRRCDTFPALKDHTLVKSGGLDGVVIY
jgi:hypothetical protein